MTEVMAVKYCVLSVGFVKSIFLPNPLDNDLAFATIDSSCDGGNSLLEDDEKRRDIPRKGVPDIATDFPLALDVVAVEEREDDDDVPVPGANRLLSGRAFGIGNAGWAPANALLLHGKIAIIMSVGRYRRSVWRCIFLVWRLSSATMM